MKKIFNYKILYNRLKKQQTIQFNLKLEKKDKPVMVSEGTDTACHPANGRLDQKTKGANDVFCFLNVLSLWMFFVQDLIHMLFVAKSSQQMYSLLLFE